MWYAYSASAWHCDGRRAASASTGVVSAAASTTCRGQPTPSLPGRVAAAASHRHLDQGRAGGPHWLGAVPCPRRSTADTRRQDGRLRRLRMSRYQWFRYNRRQISRLRLWYSRLFYISFCFLYSQVVSTVVILTINTNVSVCLQR